MEDKKSTRTPIIYNPHISCTWNLPNNERPNLYTFNVGPKSDHVERSDLAKRFFITGWERERAERERERKRERERG
jgi:hypothetical protein